MGVRYTVVLDKFRHILSKIELKEDSEIGLSIKLIDYEHRDYIEDVLCEQFDIETNTINEDISNDFILTFPGPVLLEKIEKAVKEINRYHLESNKEYDVQ